MRRQAVLLLCIASMSCTSLPCPALFGVRQDQTPKTPLVATYLENGEYVAGLKALQAALQKEPNNDQHRFGLGMLQMLHATDQLMQQLYDYGFGTPTSRLAGDLTPLSRIMPLNPNPKKLSYSQLRQIIQNWLEGIQQAEATLAGIKDVNVKLPLQVEKILLPMGHGKSQPLPLGKILQDMGIIDAHAPAMLIVFDRGDVSWARGYLHLLMFFGDVALAHDAQDLFDCAGHLFFPNIETPHAFLLKQRAGEGIQGIMSDWTIIADVVAMIHQMRFPLKEPIRMRSALNHLEQCMQLSRETWKYVLAETDDDHEWIPNPKQTGVLRIKITSEMVNSWNLFLSEMDGILAGKKLIPFWRDADGMGINLRKVFIEPRTFDLVLWVQGTAATPYLEKGTVTNSETWAQLQRVFQGNFIGFAFWFN